MNEFEIGDVVIYNGRSVVVVAMNNHENMGSCSYDREYLLCDLEYLKRNQGIITMSNLTLHGRWVSVRGTKFPEFEKANVAPFSIEGVECVKIRQKTVKEVKTITIFE